ncbi:hypothetical protein Tco_0162387 [Tanacetum coccineum]
MGDDNPIRTLGDYSKPSHEGYRNTIEFPAGNNVETDISQKGEKPSKKRQNRTRDGKVCEDEAQSKSSQLREEKAKNYIT